MILKKLKLLFDKMNVNRNFSDMAYLGDLRNYNLSDLQNRFKGRWNEHIEIYSDYQSVHWSNSQCSYVILFTLSGEIIRIKEEKWIKENIVFSFFENKVF